MRRWRWVAFYILCICGCGDGRLETYLVKGRVTFTDGAPLPRGTIEFQPALQAVNAKSADPTGRVGARGAINEDGTFEMSTFEPGDGAIEGKHRVLVTAGLPPGPIDPFAPNSKPLIHARFQRFETSGLEFTVTPDGENDFEITVERP